MNSFQNYGSYHPVNSTKEDPTHEYVDCEIINNSTTDLSPIRVIFNQIKTSHVIDNCDHYYLSVIRWSLDSGLPQIVPQIQLGPGGNVNDTVYKLNIGIQNIDGTGLITYPLDVTTIIFVPDDNTVPVPTAQPTRQDQVNTNPYYFISSISHFLEMVNKALSDAYDKLVVFKNQVSPVSPIAGKTIPVAPPHFDWNGSEISCNIDAKWIYNRATPAPGAGDLRFYISMNTPLYNLFDTFPSKFVSNTVASSDLGANYNLFFYENQWESNYSAGTPLIDYYVFNQEGSSVPAWSPVSSIVFRTSTIPVNPTNTGAPTYSGENLKNSIQASAISSVLTDFQIPLEKGNEYSNALLYYTPSGEYRLFDLISNGGLLNLNVEIYWKDKLGFVHPFLLKNGASATLKLLFRKKSYNGL